MTKHVIQWLLIVAILSLIVHADYTTNAVLYLTGNSTVSSSSGANDSSGNSNHATAVGSLQYDTASQSYNTTGNGIAYLNVPNSNSLGTYNYTRNITIMAWVQLNASFQNNSFGDLFQKGSGNSLDFEIYFSQASQALRFKWGNGSTTDNQEIIGINSVEQWTDGEWHHVAAVLETCGSNRVYGYADGVIQDNTSSALTNCTWAGNTTNALKIGDGVRVHMREIRIYNQSLTAAQIRSIADQGPYSTSNSINRTLNFTQIVGVVNSHFLGTNTASTWGAYQSWIDTNNDTTQETRSNAAEHLSEMTAIGLGAVRTDASLDVVEYNNGTFKTVNLTNTQDIQTHINGTAAYCAAGRDVPVVMGYMSPFNPATNSSCSSKNSTCPALNQTRWNQTVNSFLGNVTTSHLYDACMKPTVGNENDLTQFWEADNPTSNSSGRATDYFTHYNYTKSYIKSFNNSMPVGVSVSTINPGDTNNYAFITSLLSSYGSSIDFLDYHNYIQVYDKQAYFTEQEDINTWRTFCANYGLNCSYLSQGEVNLVSNHPRRGSTSDTQVMLDATVAAAINNEPAKMSVITYFWQSYTKNSSSDNYTCFYETLLGKEYRPCYRTLERFNKYHGNGSTVYNITGQVSDQNRTCVVLVASSNSTTNGYLTAINSCSMSATVTIPFTGRTVNSFVDVNTSTSYSVTGNQVSFNISNQTTSTFQMNFSFPTNVTLNISYEIRTVPTNFQGANVDVFLGTGANDGSSVNMTETQAAFNLLFQGSACMRVDAYDNYVSSGYLFSNSLHDISRNEIEWAYNETVAGRPKCVDLVHHGTPSGLANVTGGICTIGSNYTCPPTNFSTLAEVWHNGTVNLTKNGTYMSVIRSIQYGNEMDNPGFWMNSVSRDANTRYSDYYTLYLLAYNKTKTWNSSAPVMLSSASPNSTHYWSGVFGNITTQSIGFDSHPYDFGSAASGGNALWADTYLTNYPFSFIRPLCVSAGASYCDSEYYSETGSNDEVLKNTTASNFNNTEVQYSRFWGEYYRRSYVKGVNWYVFMQYSCNNNTPFWAMYGRLAKCGTPVYYAPFNTTKDFGLIFPNGTIIINSTSTSGNVYSVAGKADNYVTVVISNNDTVARNVTVIVTSGNISGATNLRSGQSYITNNTVVYLNEMQSNTTIYLNISWRGGCEAYYGTPVSVDKLGVARYVLNTACTVPTSTGIKAQYACSNLQTFTPLNDTSLNFMNITYLNAALQPVYNTSVKGFTQYAELRGLSLPISNNTYLLNFTELTNFTFVIDYKMNKCLGTNGTGLIAKAFRYGMYLSGASCTYSYGLRNGTVTDITASSITPGLNRETAVLEYNASNRNMTLFLNGTYKSARTTTVNTINSNVGVSNNISIVDSSGVVGGNNGFFNGTVYSFCIYNRTLSDTEKLLVSSPVGCEVVRTGLVAAGSFNNNTQCLATP